MCQTPFRNKSRRSRFLEIALFCQTYHSTASRYHSFLMQLFSKFIRPRLNNWHCHEKTEPIRKNVSEFYAAATKVRSVDQVQNFYKKYASIPMSPVRTEEYTEEYTIIMIASMERAVVCSIHARKSNHELCHNSNEVDGGAHWASTLYHHGGSCERGRQPYTWVKHSAVFKST